MNKTVKKLDNNLVKALTIACESFKDVVPGFQWLTHSADYANFPGSLVITCVFNTNLEIQQVLARSEDALMRKTIQQQLLKVGVLLKDVRRNVFLDSEEACLAQHNGDWQARIL
ncbi:Fis family transcriptional regulator [Paraglaciecola aquimarina]|uniref:Fis family transcriptional regulator n=1 Tax=Paraglaciecola algarum TaxID=3050085 RepID=A0ABS9D9T0_9ALTE|nr:Fis family transcriptional regulator [Paraglaciecola sp. G1-23]MCF2949641.1 Fis family transcriptional regulator [Paraglaciecola sp. G1-23]